MDERRHPPTASRRTAAFIASFSSGGTANQGLTLLHFLVQPEPFFLQNTPYISNNTP